MPSTVIFDNLVTQSFAGCGWNEMLLLLTAPVLWLMKKFAGFMGPATWDFFGVILLACTLKFQSDSAERTARMEMAKVLTEAFSHSEMFAAIRYFLQISETYIDVDGNFPQSDRDSINANNPDSKTEPYRHRIFTTLRHVQHLYKIEKADTELFTSLITPDIVEVTLCLYKLNDYIKDFNEPVYKMVYKVFEDIRRSYVKPLLRVFSEEKEFAPKRLQQTRRILINLKAWDRRWGDEADCILTKKDLILLDLIKASFSGEALQDSLKSLDELIEKIEDSKSKVPPLKKRKVSAELYFYLGLVKYKQKYYDEAIADFDEALKRNPQNATIYIHRGNAKYQNAKGEQKKYIEAIADYREAIRLDRQNADAYYNRAEAYQQIGKIKLAEADYTKAKQLEGLEQ